MPAVRGGIFFAATLAAFIFRPTPVTATEWKLVTLSRTSTNVFVDVDSLGILQPIEIQRPFEVRKAWVKYDYKYDKTEKLRESIFLVFVDCKTDRNLIVSMASYLKSGIQSGRTFTQMDYDVNYTYSNPETTMFGVVDFICGRRSALVK